MVVCYTEGVFHKVHKCIMKVSYVHIKDDYMIIRTDKADLNVKMKLISDINIYHN